MDLRARDATRARCNVLGQPPSWFMNRAPVGTARRSFQCQARKFPQWRACAIRRRFHCVPQTGSMESEASRRRSQGRLGPTGDRARACTALWTMSVRLGLSFQGLNPPLQLGDGVLLLGNDRQQGFPGEAFRSRFVSML